MTVLTSKVCIVGDFAVGKTSTVERYVNQQFSEKYLTTVGVKIDTREIEMPDRGIRQKLVLWDVAGTNRFGDIEFNYLRGAAGLIYVADGTRSTTIDAASRLKRQVEERYGEVPAVFLVNKCDLRQDWDCPEKLIDRVREDVGHVYVTSAKTGESVEEALNDLARLVADAELGAS